MTTAINPTKTDDTHCYNKSTTLGLEKKKKNSKTQTTATLSEHSFREVVRYRLVSDKKKKIRPPFHTEETPLLLLIILIIYYPVETGSLGM